MTILRSCLLLVALSITGLLHAQSDSTQVIQLSGQIFYELGGKPQHLAFANIGVEGTSRGTISDFDGFFSIAIDRDDKVSFSYLGLRDYVLTIPDSVTADRYFTMIMMTNDTLTLEAVVILPIPSREHFDIEFAAMDVTDELTERIEDNLSGVTMEKLRREMIRDGKENFNEFIKDKQAEYYAAGQQRPQNILNPLAWKQFIEDIKSKKKKKKN